MMTVICHLVLLMSLSYRQYVLLHSPWIKDSYSFEMRMCGTVKCTPTLAYRVHFDSINIRARTDYKIPLQWEIGPMLF